MCNIQDRMANFIGYAKKPNSYFAVFCFFMQNESVFWFSFNRVQLQFAI